MDKIIVYLNDADHALQQLAPMKNGNGRLANRSALQATEWVLVACPPHMTKHISKWVSPEALDSWRATWSGQMFAQIVPTLEAQGDSVVTVVAKGPLPALTERLLKEHGSARVLDARRTHFGEDLPPVTRDQPTEHESRWSVPGVVAGMGLLLVLAAD